MLKQHEVIARADAWVRSRFTIVPRVASSMFFTESSRRRMRETGGVEVPEPDWNRLSGKWLVSYACSWDTDAAGLPETLHVLVDDQTGVADRYTG